ncbi:MAG: DUF4011 domain-containing protein, partial [Candidatus Binatia bacterium]
MTLRDPVQEKSVATYINRLMSGVSRSAVLKAFPTRTVKRIDLSRFRIAYSNAPEEMVQTLVRPESTHRLVFADYRHADQRGTESRALLTTLRTKLSREAEAAHRETGLWMLWLAYPLLYAPHPNPENDDYLLAPLFLWPIRIQTTGLSENEINLKRESGAPRFNRIAWQWIRRHLDFDPTEPNGVDLLELQSYQDLRELVSKCCVGFRPGIDATLTPQVVAVPTRQTLKSWPHPRLLDSGVVGLIQWENMELLADLESLHQRDDLLGPAGEFLREQKALTRRVLEPPPEKDRFLVTFADHSQERAIWQARHPEGVVVHGPPGTGKSQVIVNIVADALAHGEHVLVVCQKKAALARLRGFAVVKSSKWLKN